MTLDENAKVINSNTIKNVQDIDKHPLFSTPAYMNGTAWFVSHRGLLQGFDLSGPTAKVVPGAFQLGSAPGANPEWRPSGYQPTNADAQGDGVVNVYDATTGAFERTLGASVAFNPFIIYTVK